MCQQQQIAPKSPFLFVNRSNQSDAGARAIRYISSVNLALTAPHQNRQLRNQDKSSILLSTLNISTMLVQLYAIMSLAAVCLVSLINLLNKLQNSPYFCVFKYARAVKQKFWNEAENREPDFFFLSPHTPYERARTTLTPRFTDFYGF